MLGNEAGQLYFSKESMFRYCLMIERHPDNIGAALFGGLIGTSIRPLFPEGETNIESRPIEASQVLPELPENLDKPPSSIGSYRLFRINTDIKAVIVVPEFHLNTAEARGRLSKTYSREDAIFNAQRCALFPALLGEIPLNAAKISEAMQDKFHQPYAADLIPGPSAAGAYTKYIPGLLGACLSSAGPSILALATSNFELIAQGIITILSKSQDIRYDWQVLEVSTDGATCR